MVQLSIFTFVYVDDSWQLPRSAGRWSRAVPALNLSAGRCMRMRVIVLAAPAAGLAPRAQGLRMCMLRAAPLVAATQVKVWSTGLDQVSTWTLSLRARESCGAADPSGASDSNLTHCLRMICASACWSMILGGRQGQHGPMDRVGWCWGMRLSMDLVSGGPEACVACFVVPRARCVLPILRLRDARKHMLYNA